MCCSADEQPRNRKPAEGDEQIADRVQYGAHVLILFLEADSLKTERRERSERSTEPNADQKEDVCTTHAKDNSSEDNASERVDHESRPRKHGAAEQLSDSIPEHSTQRPADADE